MKQQYRLVTSESELFVGALLEIRGCPQCRGTHQTMIVGEYGKPEEFVFVPEFGPIENDAKRSFRVAPNHHPKIATKGLIFSYAIARKGLYIIETGLESESTATKTRVKEDVK